MADLELALTHLQQDVEMPDVVLTPHQLVTQVCEKVSTRSSLYTLRPKYTDVFLTALYPRPRPDPQATLDGRRAVPEDFLQW
jgi:hypothetical protein